jgi:hypothetical protein
MPDCSSPYAGPKVLPRMSTSTNAEPLPTKK